MRQSDIGVVFDAGVDYLTVTTTDRKARRIMTERALAILRKEEGQGFDLRPWTMMGFQGYACGGVQLGEHDGRVICRLSGEVAKEHWRSIGSLHETCSRLDLQVTVRFECEAMHAIAKTFRRVKRNRHEDGKSRTVSLYQSSNGSATVYVGQRVSENYGRVYAKGLETKLPFWDNSVRFEAEFKGDQAEIELRRILLAESDVNHAYLRCRQFFSIRGCNPRWTLEVQGEPVSTRDKLSEVDLAQSRRRTSDATRRLLWLENFVRGTVQELIAQGYMDHVMKALGLSVGDPLALSTPPTMEDREVGKEA